MLFYGALFAVFQLAHAGSGYDYSQLSSNGINVCTMQSTILLTCDTQSAQRRADFPDPSPCSCNTVFFNIFCACQRSKGETYDNSYINFQTNCAQSGQDVTQSAYKVKLSFNPPAWASVAVKNDQFDEDAAFRVALASENNQNDHGLSPGVIVGIAAGGTAVLVFLCFLIWKVRSTHRDDKRHQKKNLGGWSLPFTSAFSFSGRQTVKGRRKGSQWAIDDEPTETFEILGRPLHHHAAAPSLGSIHPSAPNHEINNPFGHSLAARSAHERNESTTSTLTPLSGWGAFRRKIRLALYSIPLPGRNVVPIKHAKPGTRFQVDGPYDPYLGGITSNRNSRNPPNAMHDRSASQASFLSAGGRAVSPYEELSEHFDLDTTGSRTNLAQNPSRTAEPSAPRPPEQERLLDRPTALRASSTQAIYEYTPSPVTSRVVGPGTSTTAVYGGSSGNLLADDVLNISRDNNLPSGPSSGHHRANNASSSTVSSKAAQRGERSNHNRQLSDRFQQRIPPPPSSPAPSPTPGQTFHHARNSSGSSSNFSPSSPPNQPIYPLHVTPGSSQSPSVLEQVTRHEQIQTTNIPTSPPQLHSAISNSSMYTDGRDTILPSGSSSTPQQSSNPNSRRVPSPVPEEGTSTGSTTFPPPATPPFASSSSGDEIHAALHMLPESHRRALSRTPSRTTTVETLPPYVARDSISPGMLLHHQEAANIMRQPGDYSGQRPVPPTLTTMEKGKLFNMDLDRRRREDEAEMDRRRMREKAEYERRREADERARTQQQQTRNLPAPPSAGLKPPPSPSGSSTRTLPPLPNAPLAQPPRPLSFPERTPSSSSSSSSSSNMYAKTPVNEASGAPLHSEPERMPSLPPPQLGPYRMMSYESMMPASPDTAALPTPPFSGDGHFTSFLDSPREPRHPPPESRGSTVTGTMQTEQWEEMTSSFPAPPS